MPWIVPSHQAPVLPLKRWRPSWFSGLGLALGTAAPDLVFIFSLDPDGAPVGHTILGQLLLVVPLVLLLHALLTRLVLPFLLPHLPGGRPLHLHALRRSRPFRRAGDAARVAASALVGSSTHLFLDGFTHGDGWAVPLVPALAASVAGVPVYDALQVGLTLLLGATALREWERHVGVQPVPGPGAAAVWEVSPAPPAEVRAVRAAILVAALAGAAAAPALRHAAPEVAPKLAAYGAVTGACAAGVALAAADRARRSRVRGG